MKNMHNFVLFCLLYGILLVFTGCYTWPRFEDYYDSWSEYGYFPQQSYLQAGETPQIIKTQNIESQKRELLSNWYWCIGYSGFNGKEYDDYDIKESLKSLSETHRAKIAIWSKTYTNTKNGTYTIPHTNYNYYVDAYGTTHSTTTTTYSTHSYSVDRYNYSAYLFIPMPEESKKLYTPGFAVTYLSQQDQDTYKQNTGCLIYVVYRYTEAFYANLSYGDIITQINGYPIYSVEDYVRFRRHAKIGDIWDMTIIKNGKEKHTRLTFNLFKQPKSQRIQ